MRYRLIVLDVDGTLLDAAHQLRPRVMAAVRTVATTGATVALATGKLLASVAPLLTALEVAGPQITLNGAAIQRSETGEPLRFAPLRRADYLDVVRAVRAYDPTVLTSLFTLDGIYLDAPHPHAGIFAEYGEGPPRIIPDLLAEELPPAAKVLLSGPAEQLAALRRQVTPLFADRLTITTTTPDFLEFFDPAAGKGQSLVALRALLEVPRPAVVAIGDGENDIPLLREAGFAIAMGNAAEATKQIAQFIAPSNDEDGVAVALEALLVGTLG